MLPIMIRAKYFIILYRIILVIYRIVCACVFTWIIWRMIKKYISDCFIWIKLIIIVFSDVGVCWCYSMVFGWRVDHGQYAVFWGCNRVRVISRFSIPTKIIYLHITLLTHGRLHLNLFWYLALLLHFGCIARC